MVRSLRIRERSSFVRRAKKTIVYYSFCLRIHPCLLIPSRLVSDAARILPRCLAIVNPQYAVSCCVFPSLAETSALRRLISCGVKGAGRAPSPFHTTPTAGTEEGEGESPDAV